MRWQIIKTIWKKELLETVRDRRTLIIMLFLPIILYPVMLIGFSQFISHQVAELQSQTGRILVIGPIPDSLKIMLKQEKAFVIVDAPKGAYVPEQLNIVELKEESSKGKNSHFKLETIEVTKELKNRSYELLKKDADILLILPKDFERSLEEERTAKAVILHDDTNEMSHFLLPKLGAILHNFRKEIRNKREAAHSDLPTGFTRPVTWITDSVAPAQKRGGYFAGRLLPMMMIIMVMLGAFYPAVDLTAGEKERGTMQTLLTAPASGTEIIFGKFLTVFVVSIFSALANLGSMAFALIYLFANMPANQDLYFQLDLFSGLIIFVQLIPLAFFFSAVMLTISVFAQSFKEAQNYLTPVYLLVIIPVILSGLPGIDLTTKSALVPVLNVALLMKELLVEAPSKDLIIIVLIANCLYSVISLLIAVRVFQSEEILLGGDKNWREIFRIKKNGMQLPSLEMGISFFALGLIFYFYIGSMLQKPSNLIEGVVLSQYLLLLAPAIILAILFKYNKRETFSLKTPGALQTVAVFMMGLSSWIVLSFVASIVQGYILKEPPIISEMMNQALGLTSDKYPLLVILFAFAVTPAICEEIFFRGMIMSGLRQRLPKWYAIGLTAIFFGIFHVSIYKIVPTAIIGLVVTWIVWETGSIFAGMLFHFMHNALGLLVMKLNWFPELMVEDKMNWAQFSGFVVLFIAGLVLFIYATRKKAEAVLPDSAEIPENSQEA